jgi:hypothetical protein
MAPILEAKQLAKTYETGGAKVLGLRGVDISWELMTVDVIWPGVRPIALSTPNLSRIRSRTERRTTATSVVAVTSSNTASSV